MRRRILIVASIVLAGCTAGQTAPTSTSPEIDRSCRKCSGYTVEQAGREGYEACVYSTRS